MLTHPEIDPVAISLGPLSIHWYGIMYVIGFLAFMFLGRMRAKRPGSVVKPDQIDDILFYGAIGVVLGGRIGYVLFYNFSAFLNDPMMIIRVWDGGMSFHGGLLGVGLAVLLLARKWKVQWLQLTDFIAPMVPIGLGAGRIGNFINAELPGRVTDVSWGMVFPQLGDNLARHPSQLYQAFLEGLVMFVVLWLYSRVSRPVGAVTGLFLVLYSLARFTVEFFRQPDNHLGFVAFDWMTMGQVLTLPMFVLGLGMMVWAYQKGKVS